MQVLTKKYLAWSSISEYVSCSR